MIVGSKHPPAQDARLRKRVNTDTYLAQGRGPRLVFLSSQKVKTDDGDFSACAICNRGRAGRLQGEREGWGVLLLPALRPPAGGPLATSDQRPDRIKPDD